MSGGIVSACGKIVLDAPTLIARAGIAMLRPQMFPFDPLIDRRQHSNWEPAVDGFTRLEALAEKCCELIHKCEMWNPQKWKVDRSDADGLGSVILRFPLGGDKHRFMVGADGLIVNGALPHEFGLINRVGMDFSRFIRRGSEM